jgi:hypothetical protein
VSEIRSTRSVANSIPQSKLEERRHDTTDTRFPSSERWAHLRFSVIGQLLAAPPAKGELKAAIEELAGRTWQHPTTGEPVRFGFSTIEHWYYRALKERTDPVGVLRRKVRANAGRQHAISDAVRQVVLAQYAAHKSWSIQLHQGGFAFVTSAPGTGKSVTLRILAERLGAQRDVKIGIVTRRPRCCGGALRSASAPSAGYTSE